MSRIANIHADSELPFAESPICTSRSRSLSIEGDYPDTIEIESLVYDREIKLSPLPDSDNECDVELWDTQDFCLACTPVRSHFSSSDEKVKELQRTESALIEIANRMAKRESIRSQEFRECDKNKWRPNSAGHNSLRRFGTARRAPESPKPMMEKHIQRIKSAPVADPKPVWADLDSGTFTGEFNSCKHPMHELTYEQSTENEKESCAEDEIKRESRITYLVYGILLCVNALSVLFFSWEVSLVTGGLTAILVWMLRAQVTYGPDEKEEWGEQKILIETPFGDAYEIFDYEKFEKASSLAKESQRFGMCVTIFSPERLHACHARIFVSANYGAFAAITDKGEVINVVRHRTQSNKNDFKIAMTAAIMNGANFLECIDTVIVPIYMQFGFVPVAKATWNDDFAPHDWDYELFSKYNNGKPDYMYMIWAGLDRYSCYSDARPEYNSQSMLPKRSKSCDLRQIQLVKLFHKYTPRKVCGADALEARVEKNKAFDF